MPQTIHYLTPVDPAEAAPTVQTGLLRVAVALNEGASVPQIVDLLFDSLRGLVPYQRIGFALMEPDGMLVCAHARSDREILWGVGARAPLAGSSLEALVTQRLIRIIDDLEAYARTHPESRTTRYILAEGMRSNLTLPVFSKGGVVGILFFSSTHRRAYGPEHVDFLRACAAVVGSAFERTALADDLRAAHEALKELDRLKALILSNVSHELRTPLHQILTYAFSLEDELAGPLTARQHEFLLQIVAGSQRLADLVEQLLDLAALQGGVLELEDVPTDIGAIARELLGEMRSAFDAAGVELRDELPLWALEVNGDPRRIAQALRSLLDNARKFTRPGGAVAVRGGREDETVWLEVADTGIGVPYAAQDKVCQPFFQVESSLTRPFGGAGLGLPLAKAIALAHGGNLSFQSTPGAGSTFRLTFPARRPCP